MHPNVLYAGDQYLAHPVADAMGLALQKATPNVTRGDVERKNLVVIDCRITTPRESADSTSSFQTALAAGTPVLLLSPSQGHIEEVSTVVGICPDGPRMALLIASRERASGGGAFEVYALSYPHHATGHAEVHASTEAERNDDTETSAPAPSSSSHVPQAPTPVGEDQLDRFMEKVRHFLHGGEASPSDPTSLPTGLKYFHHVLHDSVGFTYSNGGVSNESGSLDATYDVWGFLSESETSKEQYLMAEASYSLSPGALHSNDSEDRGFGNAYLTSGLEPDLTAVDHIPTDGSDDWQTSVSVPISYKSPVGGYDVYHYEASVSQSIGSWSVTTARSGNRLGSKWYMNSPVNGLKVDDDWRDAFSFWGHVKDLPGATLNGATFDSVSVWHTSDLRAGVVSVGGPYGWEGVRFWSSSCFLGQCSKIHAVRTRYSSTRLGFSADFSPITPDR